MLVGVMTIGPIFTYSIGHSRYMDIVIEHHAEALMDVGLFFIQAEDGIRDVAVTGVQTCALPISIKFGTGIIGCSYMRILEIMLEHVTAANDVKETRNSTNYIQFLYTAFSIRLELTL